MVPSTRQGCPYAFLRRNLTLSTQACSWHATGSNNKWGGNARQVRYGVARLARSAACSLPAAIFGAAVLVCCRAA
jgi:hypothetical protein